MRSRFLGLTIIAALLLNLLGAEFAFARADNMPACCLRAAHEMHCHGMATEQVAAKAHYHSSTGFVADRPMNCACPVGFAPGSAAVPLAGNASIAASATRPMKLASLRQVAASFSLIGIHGDRAPPMA